MGREERDKRRACGPKIRWPRLESLLSGPDYFFLFSRLLKPLSDDNPSSWEHLGTSTCPMTSTAFIDRETKFALRLVTAGG